MINLNTVFPDIVFSTAELVELSEHLDSPVVKKYLKYQQSQQVKTIGNGLPKEGESAESYLRRQAVVVGGLGVLEALLKIEKPTPAQSS